jgi:energy-converting hydrogenase B subunit D
MINISVLNAVIMLGIIAAGFLTVVIDDILPCIICLSVVGALIALEFLLLRAPDVAIAEAAVGAVLTPIIFIITLRKVRGKENRGKQKGED